MNVLVGYGLRRSVFFALHVDIKLDCISSKCQVVITYVSPNTRHILWTVEMIKVLNIKIVMVEMTGTLKQ